MRISQRRAESIILPWECGDGYNEKLWLMVYGCLWFMDVYGLTNIVVN